MSGLLAAAMLLLPDPVMGSAPPDLIEGLTSHAIELARANASRARLPDGSPLPAATAEDRQRFAVPPELEAQTVRRGMLTGQLLYCKGDGIGRSFLPYMRQLRTRGRYSNHQLAYLGLLHGVSQQMIMGAMDFSKTEVCTDAFRQRLESAADAEPVRTP